MDAPESKPPTPTPEDPAPQQSISNIKPESKLVRSLKNVSPFTYFFSAVLAISLIALAYFALQNLSLKSQLGMSSFRLPGVSATCTYQGTTFKPGETVPSVDGCNSCSCDESGQVMCTLMACEVADQVVQNNTITKDISKWSKYISKNYYFNFPNNYYIDTREVKQSTEAWNKDASNKDFFELTVFNRTDNPNVDTSCFYTDRSDDEQPERCIPPILSIDLNEYSKTEFPDLESLYALPHIKNSVNIDEIEEITDDSGKKWHKVIAITTPTTEGYNFFHETSSTIFVLSFFKDPLGYWQYENQWFTNPTLQENWWSQDLNNRMNETLDPAINQVLSSFEFNSITQPTRTYTSPGLCGDRAEKQVFNIDIPSEWSIVEQGAVDANQCCNSYLFSFDSSWIKITCGDGFGGGGCKHPTELMIANQQTNACLSPSQDEKSQSLGLTYIDNPSNSITFSITAKTANTDTGMRQLKEILSTFKFED